MKKLLLASAVAALFCNGVAQAEEAAKTHNFFYNITATSDYRFRGLSKSDEQLALQGSVTYVHSSGLYARAWISSLKNDPFGADNEIDLILGYKGKLASDLVYNVGIVDITFNNASNLNTTEVYAGLEYGPVSVMYSRSITDFCQYNSYYLPGSGGSVGSSYLSADAKFDIGNGFGLGIHAGHQNIRNYGSADDYSDYSISLHKTIGGIDLSLSAVDNDLFDHDSTVVLSASKNF